MRQWNVDAVVKVVDGDTVHVHASSAPEVALDDLAVVYMSAKPWKCRVQIVDTPERGEPGHAEATAFTRSWLAQRDGAVMVDLPYKDNFGRFLADFYVRGDRQDTLTQALLQAGYATYQS